jgi:Flp pilus assembly protein TadD
MEGDYDKALKYYKAAADMDSSEPVIVTPTRSWRGKSISRMAEDSAKRLRERMKHEQNIEAQVRRLNLSGVSALNRNDLHGARQYFEQAYKIDPENPFVLNNRGYVAEMDGDSETAQVYYEKARLSPQADARVGLATRLDAEGKKLFEVADQNDQTMDAKMAQLREVRRRRSGPIVLKRRDNTPVESPEPSIQEQRQELGPPQPPVPQMTTPPAQYPPQQ